MKDPLKDTMLVFTDGFSNRRTVYVVDGKGYVMQTNLSSAQIVELGAVAVVVQLFANKGFNLHTDSQYIFKALQFI